MNTFYIAPFKEHHQMDNNRTNKQVVLQLTEFFLDNVGVITGNSPPSDLDWTANWGWTTRTQHRGHLDF